jgi:TPR repeat protein
MSSMAAGYVYVLANSSMPGLVKVGKTTRAPSERADELSGVTGVATPFIVAYEEYFEDCDAVEMSVHTVLSAKGLRLSESREFFRAAVSDVVKALISVKAPEGHRATTSTDELSGLLTPDDSEFESLRLDECRAREPWDDLMDEANKHYYGTDGYIQDYSEAVKLFRDAARLGSPEAYERLGNMYVSGEDVRQDRQRALDCYKEGAKRGNYSCHAEMASLFVQNRQMENARKALSKFISNGEAVSWKTQSAVGHVKRIKFVLAPFANTGVDRELLSIARAYLPQVRDTLQEDLGAGGAAARYPGLRPSLVELLGAIESQLR